MKREFFVDTEQKGKPTNVQQHVLVLVAGKTWINEKTGRKRKKELHKKQRSKELREGYFPQQDTFSSAITGWEGLRGGTIASPPKWARSYLVRSKSIVYRSLYDIIMPKPKHNTRAYCYYCTQLTRDNTEAFSYWSVSVLFYYVSYCTGI